MLREIILMAHVVLDMGCLLAAVWLFVDVLNASGANAARIRGVSVAAAVFI